MHILTYTNKTRSLLDAELRIVELIARDPCKADGWLGKDSENNGNDSGDVETPNTTDSIKSIENTGIDNAGSQSQSKFGLRSPLHWSKSATKTDLVELIVALTEAGVLSLADGSKPGFSQTVGVFEAILNISIGDARFLKSKALNRKLKPTGFLDRLKIAFIERTQR